jgi:hypothetical protein
MMSAGRVALWILVLAIFATASCAQACVDFSTESSAPTTDCPLHHKKDCCRHENPNSGTAASAVTHVNKTKDFVVVDQRMTSATYERPVLTPSYRTLSLDEDSNSAVHAIPLILRI